MIQRMSEKFLTGDDVVNRLRCMYGNEAKMFAVHCKGLDVYVYPASLELEDSELDQHSVLIVKNGVLVKNSLYEF